jgi:long-chain acyl-CoA synthetase
MGRPVRLGLLPSEKGFALIMATFYERFRENAERWPNNIAVEVQRSDRVESYTYAELRRMAESIGRWLSVQALEPGARVVILGDNHPRWFAAYLGILAARAVAVPLDTALHADQIAKLLKDSGSSRLFCDAKYLAVARAATADFPIGIVVLDGGDFREDARTMAIPVHHSAEAGRIPLQPQMETRLESIIAAGPADFAPPPSADDDLAALLYTSGTTADPKGVMLRHANLMGAVQALLGWAPFDSSDAVLGVLPLFHVLAQTTNFVVPLAVGARVVFLETVNSHELMRALADRKITALTAVPQFFYLIHQGIFKVVAGHGRLTQLAVRALMSLTRLTRRFSVNSGKVFFRRIHRLFGENMRYLVSAGSRFDPKVARDFHSLGIDIMQAYGLTETTGGAFATRPGELVIGSVGPALAGVQGKIVDAQLDESIGRSVGEIAIHGALVMKGYWNRPEITADVVRDGWLHTGDLGYFDADGNLFITGRKKEVIILANGKNVYPEEVEAHYLSSPFIKDICVLSLEARAGDPASEHLHAVVVPNFDELKQRKIVNLKEHLRFDIENLSVQVPSTKRIGSYEIWQDDLPRTTTRKIKRFEVERRVRANHSKETPAAGTGPERPLSAEDAAWLEQPDVQRALTVIRETCRTNLSSIRPDANLELDLGIDSMQRVELITALEQTVGGHAERSRLLEAYTVRQLVDIVLETVGRGTPNTDHAGVRGWHEILQEDSPEPNVLVLTQPGRMLERVWYLLNGIGALIAYGLFQLRVFGVEKIPVRGPFLICANHQSLMDGVVMSSLLPWRVYRELFFVGTSDIFSTGLMRVLARWRRIIVVDADANLIPAMRAGAFGLRHGRVLMLYPEGERSIDGKPKAFKRGAAILSIHMQVPIVPVAIEGFYDALPRGRRFPRLAPMRIRFGDPIHPPAESEASIATYDELTAELRNQVVQMWEDLRSQPGATMP